MKHQFPESQKIFTWGVKKVYVCRDLAQSWIIFVGGGNVMM